MLELNELSRIGFGTYRVAFINDHYQSLKRALELGCNLIDTAPNYSNGHAETLVGKVLKDNKNLPSFVITKAGYIDHNTIKIAKEKKNFRSIEKGIVTTKNGELHSIQPEFLDLQIKNSCKRLQRKHLDGFLLHNPEYLFLDERQNIETNEYYTRIKEAFSFLEEKVKQGVIRYYGISSNTFPFNTKLKDVTNLTDVIKIAQSVSSTHHFKLIQFPFNIIENHATMDHDCGKSILKIAKENNITILSNRPLNANSSSGSLRLAEYDRETIKLDESVDRKFVEAFLYKLSAYFKMKGIEDNVMDFVPIQVIYHNWNCFENTELIDIVLTTTFILFFKDFLNIKSLKNSIKT